MNTIELFEAHNLPLAVECVALATSDLKADIARAINMPANKVRVLSETHQLGGELHVFTEVQVFLGNEQIAYYDYFADSQRLLWMH